jgi:hypothetical protein
VTPLLVHTRRVADVTMQFDPIVGRLKVTSDRWFAPLQERIPKLVEEVPKFVLEKN